MIIKELDASNEVGKYAVAGRKAEEKMAFYLKRYFSSSANVYVLNHIRIEHEDDAAQIDHLVIHPYGMTIVESKSVHGKVQIKDDGQWIRWYGKQSKGMASPITQAKLQGAFLKDYLNRAAKPNDFFTHVPLQVLTAISDDGLILWPKDGKLAEVWKADQIADNITATLDKSTASENKEILSQSHIEKLCNFLCESHKPYARKSQHKVETEVEEYKSEPKQAVAVEKVIQRSTQTCPSCKSTNLEIRFRRTYHFHCLACEKNTPIKNTCPTCNEKMKLRKKRKSFSLNVRLVIHQACFTQILSLLVKPMN